jgi:hypothetical protein
VNHPLNQFTVELALSGGVRWSLNAETARLGGRAVSLIMPGSRVRVPPLLSSQIPPIASEFASPSRRVGIGRGYGAAMLNRISTPSTNSAVTTRSRVR